MVPYPEIVTVTEIEKTNLKEGKKDEVEDQTKNIVWGLGFLKNLLDEENLKELMKTTNLGDVCQDLGRGIKTTQTKRRKIEKEAKKDKEATSSMGSGIDMAVNALLGDTPALVDYGSALMSNLATKEVKAVVCIIQFSL